MLKRKTKSSKKSQIVETFKTPLKSNFMPSLQELKDSPKVGMQKLLDLKDEMFSPLSLLDRAKLFVKFLTLTNTNSTINSIKFRTTKNLTLTDATLPSKAVIFQLGHLAYGLEKSHTLQLSEKDAMILLIYVYNKIVHEKK